MSTSLPDFGAIARTGATFAKDIAERVVSSFVIATASVEVASGPADMFHASFWQAVGAGGLAAVGSLLKGMMARAIGDKNSASLAKGV